MNLLAKVAVILGGKPDVSETDRKIIETMIEIGAAPEEIVDTFGYAPEQIEAVAEAPDATGQTDALPAALQRLPKILRG